MENGKEFKVEMPDGCSMTFVDCEDKDIPKDFDGGMTDGGKVRMDFSKICPVNIEFPDGIEFDGDEEDIDFSKLYPESMDAPDGVDFDGDIYYKIEEDPIYEVPLATGEPFRVGDILYRIVPGYGIYKKVGKHKYYVSLLGNLDESTFYDLIPNVVRFLRAKSCNITPDVVYIDTEGPNNFSNIVKVYNIKYMSYDSTRIEPELAHEFKTSEFLMDEFEPMVYPCIERVR